jgi:ubiquinone/menaquinone biosynthesis C-methylase UbiE
MDESKMKEQAIYTHGHHPSVLRSHTWRTAANSASYLLPHLRPDTHILDIGCGPGTITVDLARLVPDGHITGLELAEGVLSQARDLASSQGLTNIEFVSGDANALPFPDGSFDVVVVHQVLQHVSNPTHILSEMRRVTKKGGIVAARESDYGGFVWHPSTPGLEHWRDTYLKVCRANGGEPNAGRMVHAWARAAGFEKSEIKCSSSNWCYSSKEEVEWWSGLWAERTVASEFGRTAKQNAGVDGKELEGIAEAWRAWGREEDAWFSVVSGEVICVKSGK